MNSELVQFTYLDAEEAVDRNLPLLIPIGSIEQHGPHLPLGTDYMIPEAICGIVASRKDCVIAPPIVYATYSRPRSGGGRSFTGSVGIETKTFHSMVGEAIADLARQGFSRIVLVNGHFENAPPLYDALEWGLSHSQGKGLLTNWWQLLKDSEIDEVFGDSFPGWEAEHAGVLETSLMEYLRPELVRTGTNRKGGFEEFLPYDIVPPPDRVIPRHGIGCSAEAATREIGEKIAGCVVDRLAQALTREFDE